MAIKTIKHPIYNPQSFNQASLLSLAMLALIWFAPTLTLPRIASETASQSFSMSTSGALTAYLNEADIRCTAKTLTINIPASEGLPGYTLKLASPLSLGTREHPTLIEPNQSHLLTFHLTDSHQKSYRSFTATSGESFVTGNRGVLNALLLDDSSQQLFLNASWTCPV